MNKKINPEFDALVSAWNDKENNPRLLCQLIDENSEKLVEEVGAYLNADLTHWASENCYIDTRPPTEPIKTYCRYCNLIGQHATSQCPFQKIAKRLEQRKTKPSLKWLSKKIRGKKTSKEEKEFLKKVRATRIKEAQKAKWEKKIKKLLKKREVIRKLAYREKIPWQGRKEGRAGRFKTPWGKAKSLKEQIKKGRRIIKTYRDIRATEERYKIINEAMHSFIGENWFNLLMARANKGQISWSKFEDILIKKYKKS